MAILVTCKFDEDPIKSDVALHRTTFFIHYKTMWKFFDAQGQVTPNRIVLSRPNLNFIELLCLSWLSASFMKIRSKMKTLSIGQHFSHYKLMGDIGFRENQSFDLICPKTQCSLSPTPIMFHIKVDQDWPTGLRDIRVWKCGRTTTRRTDGGPLVFYKLTFAPVS